MACVPGPLAACVCHLGLLACYRRLLPLNIYVQLGSQFRDDPAQVIFTAQGGLTAVAEHCMCQSVHTSHRSQDVLLAAVVSATARTGGAAGLICCSSSNGFFFAEPPVVSPACKRGSATFPNTKLRSRSNKGASSIFRNSYVRETLLCIHTEFRIQVT